MRPYRIFRTWIWELLALILAIGLIIAIAVLLATHDGKPAPRWGFRLNFNALLALLSTIHRAMLVVMVSQVISQRKWEWYGGDRARPLSDLQRFDSGSRGSFGALLLIPIVLWKDVVTLVAAIIFFASFLVGPFVQQASRTSECSFPVSGLNASIPYAHYIPRRGGYYDEAESPNLQPGTPSPDIVATVLASIMAPQGVENQMNPSCSSGNCTFPNGDPEESPSGRSGYGDLTSYSTVGMCSRCTDVVSLVSTSTSNTTKTTEKYITYALPNGFNFTYSRSQMSSDHHMAELGAINDLQWMAELFTSDLRAMSRWAYANVTFMARARSDFDYDANLTAVVCSLYPCLRTYTVSVTNNELDEREIRSDILQPDTEGRLPALPLESYSSLYNPYYHYAAVKAPCRVEESIYDEKNMSSLPMATNLTLYGLADSTETDPASHHYIYRNITAPEQCIYRQDARFVKAISTVFHEEIFDGYCNAYKGLQCYRTGYQANSGMLTDLATGALLRTLFNDGAMRFDDIHRWFESFTNAMTNRFRFEYGTNVFNDTIRNSVLPEQNLIVPSNRDLPLGLVQGLAWQTTTCISMHIYWLLLPIILTLVTVLLSVWTIFENWRHRHDRPVWKESILPLIFYSHRIEATNLDAFVGRSPREELADDTEAVDQNTQQQAGDTSDEEKRPVDEEEKLMEASKMMEISKNIPTTLRWPKSAEAASTTALQEEKVWPRRRIPEAVEMNSLLGEHEESTRPASRTSTISRDNSEADVHEESLLQVSRPTTADGRT